MKLPGKDLYGGDEVILENYAALQHFKQLTENCSNLETDVKYKDAVLIPQRPTIITCTGDLFPHFSSELPVIQNRCTFIYMQKLLSERIPVTHIPMLLDNAEYFLDIVQHMFTKEMVLRLQDTLQDTTNESVNSKYNDILSTFQ